MGNNGQNLDRKGVIFVPIKWDPVKVTEAADMLEEYLEEAREPLERALLVAQEARKIENLPQYVGQSLINLAWSIEGCHRKSR
ncbi:MAG: hypothetical protein HYX80_09275 [Chloroflexi bacterium]|nr:hypothetical protein [Chloroflexota bacterium]